MEQLASPPNHCLSRPDETMGKVSDETKMSSRSDDDAKTAAQLLTESPPSVTASLTEADLRAAGIDVGEGPRLSLPKVLSWEHVPGGGGAAAAEQADTRPLPPIGRSRLPRVASWRDVLELTSSSSSRLLELGSSSSSRLWELGVACLPPRFRPPRCLPASHRPPLRPRIPQARPTCHRPRTGCGSSYLPSPTARRPPLASGSSARRAYSSAAPPQGAPSRAPSASAGPSRYPARSPSWARRSTRRQPPASTRERAS